MKLNATSVKYQIENQISAAISTGDTSGLSSLLQIIGQHVEIDPLDNSSPDELLKKMKLSLLVANTYSRIAANNGGLDPLYIHMISERCTRLIEGAPSLCCLEKHVTMDMFMEYCEAVKQFSTANYSILMKEIVSYISKNLVSDMTLTNVSSVFGIHPVHLARKFKQETGITFIGFVNAQRINLAKYLLYMGKFQLSEVVEMTGFNSHSYFTKVFKKQLI